MATSAGTMALMNLGNDNDSSNMKQYQCEVYGKDGKTITLNAKVLAPEADVAVSFFDNMIQMEILKENPRVLHAIQGLELKRIRCSI